MEQIIAFASDIPGVFHNVLAVIGVVCLVSFTALGFMVAAQMRNI